MLSTLCDDPRSKASLQVCDVPPIPLAMGHRHKSHWKRMMAAGGIANKMAAVADVARGILEVGQDGARW